MIANLVVFFAQLVSCVPAASSHDHATHEHQIATAKKAPKYSGSVAETTRRPLLNGFKFGNVSENHLPSFPIKVDGKVLDTFVTMDANWRYICLMSSLYDLMSHLRSNIHGWPTILSNKP